MIAPGFNQWIAFHLFAFGTKKEIDTHHCGNKTQPRKKDHN